MGQNHLCRLAGQPAEERLQLGKMEEGDDDQQSDEEVIDWGGKQRMQGDVDRRDVVIIKTGLKRD